MTRNKTGQIVDDVIFRIMARERCFEMLNESTPYSITESSSLTEDTDTAVSTGSSPKILYGDLVNGLEMERRSELVLPKKK